MQRPLIGTKMPETVYIMKRNNKAVAAFVNAELALVVADDLQAHGRNQPVISTYYAEETPIPLITHPHEAIAFREAEKKR